MKKQYELKVFYDGLCRVCSAEIEYYKKQSGSAKINFVDIFSPDFNAESENLDPAKIHKHLHAKKEDGSVLVGVDVFIEIWKNLDRFKKISVLAENKIIKTTLKWGYKLFADIRPYLPRRKAADCTESPYCTAHNPNS
ncbi:DUF393 domain-containing protein [bacterium]|nr:DUF393 domain-containing protein [bacterium]